MFEQFLLVTAEKVPALGLMVLVVVFFLKHLKTRDESAQALHRESNTIILENTHVLGGVTKVLEKCNGYHKET